VVETNKVTILGSGTSTGVPTIGCQCDVCQSSDPKDKRLRSSIYLETKNGNHFIIDTTPDLRTQVLRENITHCDGAFITHEHADHIHGIDDLKPFGFKQDDPINIFTHQKCAQFLHNRFPYIFNTQTHFKGKKPLGSGVPKLKLNTIQNELNYQGDQFYFELLPHGHTQSLSIYHDGLLYIIDCSDVNESWIEFVRAKGVHTLIIDCVRIKPHQTHLNLEKSLYFAQKIGAQKSYLTHMTHDFSYQALKNDLKSSDFWVEPAYDGLKIQYGL
jgi:phosphoribosyl 1,2-cyclic phosphate phosphodiesterase